MRSPRGERVYLGFGLNNPEVSAQPDSGRTSAAPNNARRGKLRWVNSILLQLVHVDQHRRDGLELALANGAEEAVVSPGVAGDAGLLDLDQERIAVAIDAQINERLNMARRIAFAPRSLARARPVTHAPRTHGLGHRVAIHPGHHQHFARAVLL